MIAVVDDELQVRGQLLIRIMLVGDVHGDDLADHGCRCGRQPAVARSNFQQHGFRRQCRTQQPQARLDRAVALLRGVAAGQADMFGHAPEEFAIEGLKKLGAPLAFGSAQTGGELFLDFILAAVMFSGSRHDQKGGWVRNRTR